MVHGGSQVLDFCGQISSCFLCLGVNLGLLLGKEKAVPSHPRQNEFDGPPSSPGPLWDVVQRPCSVLMQVQGWSKAAQPMQLLALLTQDKAHHIISQPKRLCKAPFFRRKARHNATKHSSFFFKTATQFAYSQEMGAGGFSFWPLYLQGLTKS